ncbi:putative lipase [Aspergillus clavatus NRRL 1]|uniref:Lipase, putative n=1 Tax=Aspergillus clavatus (strain ATCC 1007 / CBS 513.65 / DSM 816 / NCTC 3887 / NRRL 1 / QM 1276 / 107) TaxID=344612 RepID=A1CD88_ASPCL|nr:lipase, putative [Aspergillus clavatus NRRL 1]EAW11815.1 lipase, putative [Aspergillus clavatus NRRL 1]
MKWSSFLEAALLCGAILSPVTSGAALPSDTASTASDQGLVSTLSAVANDPAINDTQITTTVSSIVSGIDETQRKQTTKGDESVERAFKKLQSVFSDGTPDFLRLAREIVRIGLVPADILSLLNGYLKQELNSINNRNPVLNNQIIYPAKAPGDVPYSVAEKALRAAIYIPSSFGYGKNGKKPVILVPGTATPAGTTYHFSFAKLGSATNVDVVWLNIPQASLNDIQINAEYVAYAINYISALTGSNVAVISWSQGGPDTQWALKYWPTTRDVVDDFIAISPDFHGTVASSLACPWLKSLLCSPALWQQAWDSEFISTLRADGGDSAYVPTTTIYSSFDEIVQPMSGSQASAILGDARAVGVSNNQVQTVCGSKPAGGIYTHEGVLYNPLAWALAVDALTHDGPGDPSRLNLDDVCGRLLPPQLGLDDFLGTEGLLLVGLAEALAYMPKTLREPPIAGYAA